MIEQLNYTPTPTYNFPSSIEHLQLPSTFLELSQSSMKNIESRFLRPDQSFTNSISTDPIVSKELPNKIQQTIKNIPLVRSREEIPIVGIDVSSIHIGETDTGNLCAIRGAVVWKVKKRYKYQRIGPYPFHITEHNKKEILKLFRNNYFELSNSNLFNMQTKMGNLLERWLQLGLSSSTYGTIILWDGSMTAGMIDSPIDDMDRLLNVARNRLNTILAFSKNTNLRIFSHKLTDYSKKAIPPCLLRIDELDSSFGQVLFLGDIYIAKLTPGICSFRLDIDKKIPQEQGIIAVQKLLGNDLLIQSYPETLRLAHIYSTFTATEVIGIQRFISQRYKLKIIRRPNIRKILFGSFGKGAEE
ncbi:DNA double-strand break repair nuclease NurA [Candidatus Bathyarchaeota archaeon]|nr:DNA double-strand break repair nuclease NurA [Candidatus Bathyarchaeota archaeon]